MRNRFRNVSFLSDGFYDNYIPFMPKNQVFSVIFRLLIFEPPSARPPFLKTNSLASYICPCENINGFEHFDHSSLSLSEKISIFSKKALAILENPSYNETAKTI